MKNILTTVAMATLLTGLSVSAANAAASSKLVTYTGSDENTTLGYEISVDRANVGQAVEMVFKPGVNAAKGSGFKVEFSNAGFIETGAITLCSELNATAKQAVGSLFSKGDAGTIINGVMTAPRFQFAPDANETIIVADSNITFWKENNCTGVLDVVSATTKSCQPIVAKIVEGKTTQGTAFPDYDTNKLDIGQTKSFIKIACSAPECIISRNGLTFESVTSAAGVNKEMTADVSGGSATTSSVLTTASCPECDETTVCTTEIVIENNNATFAIKGLDLTLNMKDNAGVNQNANFTPKLLLSVDGVDYNATENYSLGTKFSPTVDIKPTSTSSIKVVYTPTTTSTILAGKMYATVVGLDSNITGATADDIKISFPDKVISTLTVGAVTKFTVPYMSANGSAKNSFVKISTLVGSVGASSLKATISDPAGNSCTVNLNDIPKNGGSTFVFASAVPASAGSQALIPTGECSNLSQTDKLYSVVFETDSAVNAVGYMRTKAGERTIDIF